MPKKGEKVLYVVADDDDFQKAYPSDAGFDIRMPYTTDVLNHLPVVVETNVRVALPENCVGILTVRSSIGARGITISGGIGVIDAGYRGKIKLSLISHKYPQTLFKGERVAQLLVVPLQPVAVRRVEELPPGDRGEKGLGSTGKD